MSYRRIGAKPKLAVVAAIASWHVNAVRVPLNEDYWLGINGVSSSYGGAAYQQAIVNYVNLLNQYGIYGAPPSSPPPGPHSLNRNDRSVRRTLRCRSRRWDQPHPSKGVGPGAASR
jgi:hypothetical protein